MNRDDLQRLSKDDLSELLLRFTRPDKTSRTSSKPPSTDRKERREQAKPGGAQPGHEGHSRKLCVRRPKRRRYRAPRGRRVFPDHPPNHCLIAPPTRYANGAWVITNDDKEVMTSM